MTTLTMKLADGIEIEKKRHGEVELRQATAGDLIDANREAEQVKAVPIGKKVEVVVVSSPTLAGQGMVRRQIVRIGAYEGPVTDELLRRFSARDFESLLAAADTLGAAAARETEQRGRDDGGGAPS